MGINQEIPKVVIKNKDFLMAFDGKSLYTSFRVDEDSYHLMIEIGCFFNPEKKQVFVKQFNNRTFNHFKDQASAILRVRYYNPKKLIFQHLPVEEGVILDGERYKDVNGLRNCYITKMLTNVDIDEIVTMGGKKVTITEELFI